MLKDEAFVATTNKKAAWLSFKKVIENFLGNHKSDNYAELVANLLRKIRLPDELQITLSPFASRLLSTKSWRLQRRTRRTISSRYQRNETSLSGVRWGINMMADFCWMLKRESVVKGKKRKRNPLHRSFEDKRVRKHDHELCLNLLFRLR